MLRHLRAAGLHLGGLGRGGRQGEGNAAEREAKAPLLQQGTLRVTSDQNIHTDKSGHLRGMNALPLTFCLRSWVSGQVNFPIEATKLSVS